MPSPNKHFTCATSCIEATRKDLAYRLDRILMYGDAPPSRDAYVELLQDLDKILKYLAGEFEDMLLAHGADLAEREAEYQEAIARLERRSDHGGPLT